MGTAISAVTTITKMLPVRACQMPACDARRDEKLVMKFHDTVSAPSATMSQMSVASEASAMTSTRSAST